MLARPPPPITPRLEAVLSYMKERACEWISRREVAEALGISYWAARARLERLAALGLIEKRIQPRPRRVYYHYAPPKPPPPLPPPPPPPPEEIPIGPEECSGYQIYYHPDEKIYKIRHPETNELIREDKKLAVEWTGTIDTNVGHDVPITLEITAVTYVTEADDTEISRIETEMDRRILKWLIETGWGPLARALEATSSAYNGETHVKTAKLYPFTVPDYPQMHILCERRSRYIPERTYEETVTI